LTEAEALMTFSVRYRI